MSGLDVVERDRGVNEAFSTTSTRACEAAIASAETVCANARLCEKDDDGMTIVGLTSGLVDFGGHSRLSLASSFAESPDT